ncbi:haloalkane dehalogenase [Bradyrhizobium sp. USDA 4454]
MSEQPLPKQYVEVLGRTMAYYAGGEGLPILFLHGNPTSSYLWRDVIPELEGYGRLIAPDFIGMGDSDKLPDVRPDTYTFATHQAHLDAFIEAVIGPQTKILLIVHDWGSALGFHWANRHRDKVQGVVYMEGIVRPFADWSEWPESVVTTFQGFRSPEGEEMILDRNSFVEQVLPGAVLRKLSETEMAQYRKPFANRADRWPTLTWPRQIPIAGEPEDVTALVEAYSSWMADNNLPKLFINAEPGAILTGAVREFCRCWKNQLELTVPGRHFIQEDSGTTIGKMIRSWISANLHSLTW